MDDLATFSISVWNIRKARNALPDNVSAICRVVRASFPNYHFRHGNLLDSYRQKLARTGKLLKFMREITQAEAIWTI